MILGPIVWWSAGHVHNIGAVSSMRMKVNVVVIKPLAWRYVLIGSKVVTSSRHGGHLRLFTALGHQLAGVA